MYRVIGREVVGKGRLERYIVELSGRQPERNIYCKGGFTSPNSDKIHLGVIPVKPLG